MKRRILAWNLLCALVTALLIGGLAPRLISHFSYSRFGRPLWRESWALSFEGIFIVLAIAAGGLAASSLFAGRIMRGRRLVGAALAAVVLGAWIHSARLCLEQSRAYQYDPPSLLTTMMRNEGVGLAGLALVFLLVAVVSGHGLFWWLGRMLRKVRPVKVVVP